MQCLQTNLFLYTMGGFRWHLQEQRDTELDEREIAELLTPRGVTVKEDKSNAFGPAEVIDQPSPVSVLDNFQFPEEESLPSPRTSKTSSSTIDSCEQG